MGMTAISWAGVFLPLASLVAPARGISTLVTVSHFKPESLNRMAAWFGAAPRFAVFFPEAVRADALISVLIAQQAMLHESSEEIDIALATAEGKLRSALQLSPTEAHLWLALYSTRMTRLGFDPDDKRYLGQSYAAGPYEGWIALSRNRLALSAFSILDPEVQNKVVLEFAGMVDSQLTEEAVSNLMDVGWSYRSTLLASLEPIDVIPKEAFAKRLARQGVKETVPGVELDERWWR